MNVSGKSSKDSDRGSFNQARSRKPNCPGSSNRTRRDHHRYSQGLSGQMPKPDLSILVEDAARPFAVHSLKHILGCEADVLHLSGLKGVGKVEDVLSGSVILHTYRIVSDEFSQNTSRSKSTTCLLYLKDTAVFTAVGVDFPPDEEYADNSERQYSGMPRDLVSWESPPGTNTSLSLDEKTTGWSAVDMFRTNERLDVKSTYTSDTMDEYMSPIPNHLVQEQLKEVQNKVDEIVKSGTFSSHEESDRGRTEDELFSAALHASSSVCTKNSLDHSKSSTVIEFSSALQQQPDCITTGTPVTSVRTLSFSPPYPQPSDSKPVSSNQRMTGACAKLERLTQVSQLKDFSLNFKLASDSTDFTSSCDDVPCTVANILQMQKPCLACTAPQVPTTASTLVPCSEEGSGDGDRESSDASSSGTPYTPTPLSSFEMIKVKKLNPNAQAYVPKNIQNQQLVHSPDSSDSSFPPYSPGNSLQMPVESPLQFPPAYKNPIKSIAIPSKYNRQQTNRLDGGLDYVAPVPYMSASPGSISHHTGVSPATPPSLVLFSSQPMVVPPVQQVSGSPLPPLRQVQAYGDGRLFLPSLSVL